MPESNTTSSPDGSGRSNSIVASASIARFPNNLAHDFFAPAVIALVTVIVAAASLDSDPVHKPSVSVTQEQQEARNSDPGESRPRQNLITDALPDKPGTHPEPYQAVGTTAPARSLRRAAGVYPYAMPLAAPVLTGYRPADSRMFQQLPVYGQALQARGQHWINIRADRAVVGQRVRQDRVYRPRQRKVFERFQADRREGQENG